MRARESSDLIRWNESRVVLLTPPGYGSAESVYVLKRDGLYYLWVCGFDYAIDSLYISDEPFDFGDVVANRIEEQPGHAPELAHTEDGRDWMACSAVASEPGYPAGPFGGLPSAHHDLPGIYVQPLEWVDATAEQAAKVVRH